MYGYKISAFSAAYICLTKILYFQSLSLRRRFVLIVHD